MSHDEQAGPVDMSGVRPDELVDERVLPSVLCDQAAADYKAIFERLNRELVGRRIRITSKYNGQSHGYSKPPLTGKVVTINRADVGHWGVYVYVDGQRISLLAREFEFVDEAQS